MSRVLNRGATPDVQKMVVDKLNQVQERLKEANIQRQKLIDALMNTRQVMQKDGTVRFESGPNPWGYQFPPPGPFSAGNPWAYQK